MTHAVDFGLWAKRMMDSGTSKPLMKRKSEQAPRA